MTDVAEEKRPWELLAGTPRSQFLLSEHFGISKGQKSIEGKTESLPPHTGVPAAGRSVNSGLPQSQEEIALLFLAILLRAWNKTNWSLIPFICCVVEMDHQEGSALPWQADDLEMRPYLHFHYFSSLDLVLELFASRTASRYACGCRLA